MKYYLDTEFIEGFHKPFLGKKRHFIDLISIGIIAEDGREYYAISNEFNPKNADEWVKENVITKLPEKYADFHDSPRVKEESQLWKSNKQIAQDIFEFCTGDSLTIEKANHYKVDYTNRDISFYGYYADYDWVLFCSLFGRMIDLPKGFPMYCKDLKQIFDERVMEKAQSVHAALQNGVYPVPDADLNKIFKDLSSDYKNDISYPKQENEHNALDDAKWNMSLHKFLNQLK